MKKYAKVLWCIVVSFSCLITGCTTNAGKSVEFAAHYIRTDWFEEWEENIRVIKSNKEINFDVDKIEIEYDDAFFKDNILITFNKGESSGSIRHEVTSVSFDENSNLIINVQRTMPEIGTTDMALWQIVIELSKKDYHDEKIIVNYKDVQSK